MSETTPLIKAALNLRVGAGFDVYGHMQHSYYFTYMEYGLLTLLYNTLSGHSSF